MFDEYRSWSTQRLEARRRAVVGEQRQLHAEELAIVAVLDERDRIDVSMGSAGESARVVREKVETARALESLPEIAAVAFDGGFSDEQLSSVVRLADEESDAEWARRAPNVAPDELARMARNANKPSAEDSRARFAARSLKMRWTPGKGMLRLYGQLPDVMGAEFEATITKLTEAMKPGKGQAWRSFEQRAADALVQLCVAPEPADEHAPTLAPAPVLQVGVPPRGPGEIAGVPIADSLLEQLRANATIEPVLVDDAGAPVAVGKRVAGLSPKLRRAVLLRDGHCRVPGCGWRRGLEVHHLVPRSQGGTDDISNLAVVCPAHHRLLIPHGVLALVGNPNLPDGLQLVNAGERAPPVLV
jgi:hypothetical protein